MGMTESNGGLATSSGEMLGNAHVGTVNVDALCAAAALGATNVRVAANESVRGNTINFGDSSLEKAAGSWNLGASELRN